MSQKNQEVENLSVGRMVKKSVEQIRAGEEATLTILTGDYEHPHEQKPLNLNGVIETPKNYLDQRGDLIEHKTANIVVDIDNLIISLSVEEENHFAKKVVGSVQVSPHVERLGINDGKYRPAKDLAKFFKMNRSFFTSKTDNMALVSSLQNLKAKVDKSVEKIDDRLHKRDMVDQVITSNLPESFSLKLPLFKNAKPVIVECELHVNAEDLSVTIISPDAQEQIDNLGQEIIADEIAEIQKSYPEILVTYK